MKGPMNRKKAWIAFLALILLAGMTGHLPVASAQSPTRAQQDHALLSTMRVWTLDADMKIMAGCTGTVVDPAGYILTNFHCVGVSTGEEKAQAKPGTFYNPKGLLAVGPTLDPRKAPKPTYMAKFVVGNYDLDVAVLKIIGMVNQNERLPKSLPLVTMNRTDSDQVQIGDYVAAIGYPSVGGNTITYTDGKIAGFDDMNGDGTPDSFKVTASINPGNSGGLAINLAGLQIGIPTWSLYNSQTGSKLDRILMINVAEPYIRKALAVGASVTGDATPPLVTPPNNPPVNPPAATSSPTFGPLKFGTSFQNGQLGGAAAAFPTGTSNIAGMFQFSGLSSSTDWGRVWLLEGQSIAGKSSGYKWTSDPSGTTAATLSGADNGPLPDGSYKLVLYINGAVATQGAFTIGQTAPPKPQPPAPPAPTGVVIKGQILDADTKRGIASAFILLLKPGVSTDEFDAALDAGDVDPLVAASADTDSNGNYQSAPPVARGNKYTVIVAAKGYQMRVFEDGLEITASDRAETSMAAISLRRQ